MKDREKAIDEAEALSSEVEALLEGRSMVSCGVVLANLVGKWLSLNPPEEREELIEAIASSAEDFCRSYDALEARYAGGVT